MDIFWFIPTVVLAVIFSTLFFGYLRRRPSGHATPQVILHKEGPASELDEDVKSKDWQNRPCGSFLEWFRR